MEAASVKPDLRPMLATLIDKPFDNPSWIFETKWDGFRLMAEIKDCSASLYSRNMAPHNCLYPREPRSWPTLSGGERRSHMKVRDTMSPSVVTVRPDASILEASELMLNHAWPGPNTHSNAKKVRKSNSELIGPSTSMKRSMSLMFQRTGRRSASTSTLSNGTPTSETS